jgi:Zn-dependent protease with chaperone function
VSLGALLLLCYISDRVILKQRWSTSQMVRRAWWRLASFVIPLLMIAAGFGLIFEGEAKGLAWLLTAGIVAKVSTGFLRYAEGMKLNPLKSGEMRNRALRMASEMGVVLRRVYVVPAGKGHLTNAYGMASAIGLTDNLGKYLNKEQVDCVIAHELAHVKLRHGRKLPLLTLGTFSLMALLSFRLSRYALPLQILCPMRGDVRGVVDFLLLFPSI